MRIDEILAKNEEYEEAKFFEKIQTYRENIFACIHYYFKPDDPIKSQDTLSKYSSHHEEIKHTLTDATLVDNDLIGMRKLSTTIF